jgi:hypothetical protein
MCQLSGMTATMTEVQHLPVGYGRRSAKADTSPCLEPQRPAGTVTFDIDLMQT